MRNKKAGTCCGALSIIVAALSIFVLFEFDSFYKDLLNKQVSITEGSTAFHVWKDVGSCFDMSVNMYFFNITNIDAVNRGKAKPRMRQMGPYIYRMVWVKDNITFNDNGTVSFLEKITFHFDAENTEGSEGDLVTTVNVPYLAALHLMLSQNMFLRTVGMMVLSSLNQQTFLTRSVRELSFEGYPDVLMMLAAVAGKGNNAGGGRVAAGNVDMASVLRTGYRTLVDMLKSQPESAVGRFAYMSGRNDTFHELLTMFTGEGDISRINYLDTVDGKRRLNIWPDEPCDQVRGSFGNVRPPLSTSNSETVFIPDLKRTFDLHHVADTKVGSLNTRRFAVTPDLFDKKSPENACYNAARKYLPSGVSDFGPLQEGVPIVVSLPHFLYGSSSLLNAVDGLRPKEQQHLFYIDSEPTTGASVSGRVRLQLNAVLKDVPGFTSFSELGYTILPLFWQEVVVEAQEHTLTRIRLAVLAPILVRCSAIFFLVGSLILAMAAFYSIFRSRRRRQRDVSDPSRMLRDKLAIYINGGSFLGTRQNDDLVKDGASPVTLVVSEVPEADALLRSTAV